MAHDIINRQRKYKIDTRTYSAFLDNVFDTVREASGRAVTVAFVSDDKMRPLNRDFRGKDATTDVLSFPFIPETFESGSVYLGDIVISVEQAVRQAKENGLTLEQEIKQLMLHGVLHLCGFDHEVDHGEMARYELKLRRKLKI